MPFLLAAPPLDFSPTVSVQAGYNYQFAPDVFEGGGAMFLLRAGAELKTFDVELGVGIRTGELAAYDWPWYYVDPRIEVMYHPEHRDRFDTFVGGGIGYRYARIDDGTSDKSKAEDELFITVDPILDFFVSAGGGVTAQLVGPLHARADLRATLTVGPDPTGHAIPGLEGVIGLEYRAEGPPDKDRDGIPDKKDYCPDQVEDIDWVEDTDGCPDPDNDNDGVPDAADQCGIPEDRDGFQDADGCPDTNNDSDNVPDSDDKCPNDAETDNDFEDPDGCPDTVPTELDRITNAPLSGVAFTGEGYTPESEARLLEVAGILAKYPDVRLQVTCYTDDDGDLAKLREVSRHRCEAVAKLFAANGVPEARVVVIGGGATMAIAPNSTPEGRAKNNRVEIVRMP